MTNREFEIKYGIGHTAKFLAGVQYPGHDVIMDLAREEWRGSFDARVAKATRVIGVAPRTWETSYPSGGGSRYAEWDLGGSGLRVRLEDGGYDMVTGNDYPVAPEVFGPLISGH